MEGDFRRGRKSNVFSGTFRSFGVAIRPDGLLRDLFCVLDTDPRPGISFFREGRSRFRA